MDRKPPFDDPLYPRRYFIGLVHELALDPDEALDAARIGEKRVHPSILTDQTGEMDLHYNTGWKSLFDPDEQAAIESYIEYEKSLPKIEDDAWADPTATNATWSGIRDQARRLINALGGLPEDFPGRWAKK